MFVFQYMSGLSAELYDAISKYTRIINYSENTRIAILKLLTNVLYESFGKKFAEYFENKTDRKRQAMILSVYFAHALSSVLAEYRN